MKLPTGWSDRTFADYRRAVERERDRNLAEVTRYTAGDDLVVEYRTPSGTIFAASTRNPDGSFEVEAYAEGDFERRVG